MVIVEKNRERRKSESEEAGTTEEQSEEVLVKVPLVDKHAQGALRRRVVHDQLERT